MIVHEPNQYPVSALLVGEYGPDRLLLHDVFSVHGWRLLEARGRRRAMRLLACHSVQVVIALERARAWTWQRVLRDLRALRQEPQLVVAAPGTDDRLWAEVLNRGGFDILIQPFVREEAERVIAAARRRCSAQSEYGLPPAALGAA